MADKEKKKQESPKKGEGAAKVPGKGAQQAKGGQGAQGKKPAKGAPAEAARKEESVSAGEQAPAVPPRLKTLYDNEVAPRLMKEFGLKNRTQVPRLVKITLNMGLGEAIANPKVLDGALEELRAIAGQQPVVTKAKKSIATFKLREGQKIGCMVTLRRARMWEFFDRLVSLALPRVRDFKGISQRSFDGRGNFSVGIKEQIIFPEINYDKIDKIKGLNVSIVTTARSDEEGRALLKYLGMPFRS